MPGTAAVIGSGIVGSASALALARAGFKVTVIDPMREPSGASFGNAGHIATEQIEPLASRAVLRSVPGRLFLNGGALDVRLADADCWVPFAVRWLAATSPARFAKGKAALGALMAGASGAWERFAEDLGDPSLYRPIGHFVIWETEKTAAAGLAQWQATDTGTAKFHTATSAELDRIAALTRCRPAGAIRFENTGQISDHPRLYAAIARAFEARGIARRYETARLVPANDRVAVTLDDGERVEADIVLVAAGARSGDVLRAEGTFAPVIAERGYHIRTMPGDWPDDLGPLTFEDRSLIVVRFASALRASSFVEFGRPDTPPDERKWARLRQHVEELGLPFALPGTPWMGSRPTLPDYIPAIGRSRHSRNLLYAFGHQHLGLTLGPVTGEVVAQLATAAAPEIPLEAFSLERFG